MADYTEDDNVVAAGNESEIVYTPHGWTSGEVITAQKLNNMEAGIQKGINNTISEETIRNAVANDLTKLGNRVNNVEADVNNVKANYASKTFVTNGLDSKANQTDLTALTNTVNLHTSLTNHDGNLYKAIQLAEGYADNEITTLKTSLTNAIKVQILTLQLFNDLGTSGGDQPEEFTYYLVERTDSKYDKYLYIKNKGNGIMDPLGSTSTEIVSSLPNLANANPDTDYIVKEGNRYFYYKVINNQWQIIGDGMVQVVETLPNSGNEWTDYYKLLSANANPPIYLHYRWKANSDGGDWIQIGADVESLISSALANYSPTTTIEATYATKQELEDYSPTSTIEDTYVTKSELTNNYYNKSDINDQIADTSGLSTAITNLQETVDTAITGIASSDETGKINIRRAGNETFEKIDLSATLNVGKVINKLEVNGDKLEVTYSTGPKEELQLPQGGGSGGSGSLITLSEVVVPNTIKNGDAANFQFKATDSENSQITVVWSVNSVIRETQSQDSGETFSFNAQLYLLESSNNTVSVTITSASEGTATRRWTVRTVPFNLAWSSTIQPIMLYTTNTNVGISLIASIGSNLTGIIKVFVNDTRVRNYPITGPGNVFFEVSRESFNAASRVNTVKALLFSSDEKESTEPISFVAIWGYQATNTIIALSQTNYSGVQYLPIDIKYLVYDPYNEKTGVTLSLNETTITDRIDTREIQEYKYTYADTIMGDEPVTLSFSVAKTTDTDIKSTATISVTRNPYNLIPVTGEKLDYNLNPLGHSNSEANRDQFGDLTFSDNFDWSNGGFLLDADGVTALVIKKGCSVTLPNSLFYLGLKILDDQDTFTGKVIDLIFKVTNSDQYDAQFLSDLNSGLNTGLILKANEGELRTGSTSGTPFYYLEEEKVELSLHVEDTLKEPKSRILTVWLDGIPSLALTCANKLPVLVNENYRTSVTTIGSNHCDVWLYSIRLYKSALSYQEMLLNYISNGGTAEQKVQRYQENQVFDGETITMLKLAAAKPDLTIVYIEAPEMTFNKQHKIPVNFLIIENGDIDNPVLQVNGGIMKVQGTSSAAYVRASANLDLDFKKVDGVSGYKISETALPVKYLNIKVNVASSENANNINAVDWYNKYLPFLTESRRRPGVRDTVEGKPCAIFFKNTSSKAQWFSSQEVLKDQTIFYGVGDLCNSKKNLEVFGQDGYTNAELGITHPTRGCIEVSDNSNPAQLFIATSEHYGKIKEDDEDKVWYSLLPERDENGQIKTDDYGNPILSNQKDFEWRMEPDLDDEETVVQAWNDTVAWVVKNKDNPQAFKSGVTEDNKPDGIDQYFSRKSLLYHFLFIEFFAAYDNVSKNTFYSFDYDDTVEKPAEDKWGGYRWNIKAAYDWDTILGCDNDGIPFGDYGIDFTDTVSNSNRSYFNANNNPIWLNIRHEQGFKNELMTLYSELYDLGAWNTNALINQWNDYLSVRPHALLMQDAYNKYILPAKTTEVPINQNGTLGGIDTSYLKRLNGSKIYQRTRFLTYLGYYMTGKYGRFPGENDSFKMRTNLEGTSLNISAYAKTYVAGRLGTNPPIMKEVSTGASQNFNIIGKSNTYIYITPQELIEEVQPINNMQISEFVATDTKKLKKVILGSSEEANEAWPTGKSLTLVAPNLQELSLEKLVKYNDSQFDLRSFAALTKLNVKGTLIGQIFFAPYAPLTSIELNACSGLSMINLNQVTTFTMESPANQAAGTSLTYLRVENCNDLINLQALTYLLNMKTANLNTTRNIRIILPEVKENEFNWLFSNTNFLNWLVATKGISNNGNTTDTSCVLLGKIKINGDVRRTELNDYEAAWGKNVVYYNSVIELSLVTFVNYDNEEIFSTWVDNGTELANPTGTAFETPVKPADVDFRYEFTGWVNSLSGALVKFPISTTTNITLQAQYDSQPQTYTVSWYKHDYDTQPLYTITGVVAGTSLDFEEVIADAIKNEPENTDLLDISFPLTDTTLEYQGTYLLFTGWDNSTGDITSNLKVCGKWESASTVSPSNLNFYHGLDELTPAQLYALSRMPDDDRLNLLRINDSGNVGTLDMHLGDHIDVNMGVDLTNFENTPCITLAKNKIFDGNSYEIIEPDVLDLKNSSNGFTLMIDYRFVTENTDTTPILFSWVDNQNTGFNLRYLYSGSSGPYINEKRIGIPSSTAYGAYGYTYYPRNIVVIRRPRNSNIISIYHTKASNVSTQALVGTMEKQPPENISFTIDITNTPIILGATKDANNIISNYGTGIIYSAILWKGDLGQYNCWDLSRLPLFPLRLIYYASKAYNHDTSAKVAMSFITDSCIDSREIVMHNDDYVPTGTVNNYNPDIKYDHPWLYTSSYYIYLNILYKSLPIWLRSIIVNTRLDNRYSLTSYVGGNGIPFDCALYMPTSSELTSLVQSGLLGFWSLVSSTNRTAGNVLYYNTPIKGRYYVAHGNNPVGDKTVPYDDWSTGDLWYGPQTDNSASYGMRFYISQEDWTTNPVYYGFPHDPLPVATQTITGETMSGVWTPLHYMWTRTPVDASNLYKGVNGYGAVANYSVTNRANFLLAFSIGVVNSTNLGGA